MLLMRSDENASAASARARRAQLVNKFMIADSRGREDVDADDDVYDPRSVAWRFDLCFGCRRTL